MSNYERAILDIYAQEELNGQSLVGPENIGLSQFLP